MGHGDRASRHGLRATVVAALVAVALGALASSASAATFSVACGDVAGLNAAVVSANGTTAADVINVTGAPCPNGFVYTTAAGPGSGGNDSALPIITQPLTINGNGATIQRSGTAGVPNFRIMFVFSTAPAGISVDLRDLILQGGKVPAFAGGAVGTINAGTLTLDRVQLIGNSASNGGALAFTAGTNVVDHALVEFNSATNAGAIYSVISNTTLRRSAVLLNAATGSTGVAIVQGGNGRFENDTIAANAAGNGIGAIAVDNNFSNSLATQGTATIESTTLTDNSTSTAAGSAPGGQIFTCTACVSGGQGAAPPVVHVHNSIVTDTDSTAAATLAPCSTSLGGSIVSDGGNLEYPTNTCPFAVHGQNPQLASLVSNNQNANGGSFFNYRLLPGSPAIDLGSTPCPATDQRDKIRPGGDGCDAGAYETHPPNTTASGPSGPTSAPQVTLASDQAGATFECRVDAGAFAACTSPFQPAGLSDGSHTVQARARAADPTSTNTANNVYTDLSPASVTFVVDATKPVVDITSAPPAVTADRDATVQFTVDDANPGTTTCKLDALAPVSCTSPFTRTGLADGPHTITVTATDAAGNTGSDSATFTVDATAPDTMITSGPSGTIFTSSATFTFTSTEDPQAFECKLDDGAFASCTSPQTVTGLLPGDHTFSVRAIDAAGNVDPDPAIRTFTYVQDESGPVVEITDAPASPTNDATPTITFTVDDATATVRCKVDSEPSVPCSSPFTADALGDGDHTISVIATDPAGNVGHAEASFTVDATPPDTSIQTGPSGTIYNTAAADFTFTSPDGGASFECRLDDGDFAACTSPQTVAFGAGPHTFAVRAVDAAGNRDPDPATRSFTEVEDHSAPVVHITDAPASPTNASTGTVGFTVDDATASVTCAVDDGAPAPCSSPFTTGALDQGSHQVVVVATDPAGNTGQDAVTWTVDRTPPDTAIDSGPSGTIYNATSVTFTFSGSGDPVGFECRLDGGAYAACTSPDVVAVTAGEHTFSVRAVDAAGNRDPDPATRTFTNVTDHTAPVVHITLSPDSPTNDPTAKLTFDVDDASAATTCKVDTGAPAPCSSPFTTAALPDGTHTVTVTATDPAGNAGSDARTFTVDTRPPDTTITGGPGGEIHDASTSFTFTSDDAGATFQCRLDGGPFAACTSPKPVSGYSEGQHTFEVRAVDKAGNRDPSPASRTFTYKKCTIVKSTVNLLGQPITICL